MRRGNHPAPREARMLAPPNAERAAPAGSGNGSRKTDRLGGSIKSQDGCLESNSQVSCRGIFWPVTRRWNSLSLDKPQRRWEIPEDVLKLAAREPPKPEWWQSRHHRSRLPIGLSSGRQTDPGRVYTQEEREAFVASRPDLLPCEGRKPCKVVLLTWHKPLCGEWRAAA